jgi:hypothetical protein
MSLGGQRVHVGKFEDVTPVEDLALEDLRLVLIENRRHPALADVVMREFWARLACDPARHGRTKRCPK